MSTIAGHPIAQGGPAWMALRLAAPGTGRPSPRGAVRMALALGGPLAVGLAVGKPVLGMIAALAAFFTALIEPVGGYRAHVLVYLAMVPVNAAVAALASAVAGTIWQAGVAGLAIGLASGILVGSTSRVAVAGPFPLFLFVVVQGTAPQPAIWAAAAAAATGAIWVALAAISLLPFAPFAPCEVHVAEGWKAIALLARDPGDARRHMMALSALESARANLIATPGRSERWRVRRRQLWASILDAEAAMVAMVTRSAAGVDTPDERDRVARMAQGIARYAIWHRSRPATAGLKHLPPRLADRLRSGLDALDADDPPAPPIPPRTPPAILAPLRSAARWTSPGFRHGLRLGIGAGGLMAVIGAYGGSLGDLTDHGPWVTITLVDVLAPSLGASVQRLAQRGLGTAAGATLAALLIWVLGDPWLVAIAAVIVATVAAFIRFVNYAWFMALFTPLVLLVASTAVPMGPGIAVQRVIATLIGCGLGFIIALVVLPTRSGPSLPGALARAVDAVADDVDAGIRVAREGRPVGDLAQVHRAAMGAAGDALQVFDGVMIESMSRRVGRSPLADMEAATFTLVERAAALGARLPERGRVVPGTLPAAEGLATSLRDIASAIRERRPPAPRADLMRLLDDAAAALGSETDQATEEVIEGLAGMIRAADDLNTATSAWAVALRD